MSTVARESRVLQAALEYGGRGWRVVPIRDGKKPRLNAWQKAASCDEETIERWFQEHPSDNVGVRLGECSGIIDIECDSPEAEMLLLKLFGDNPPVTPTFAAKRGKHRLFKWRGDLPAADKAVFKFGDLEFRTGNGDKGAQSVFPPSIHDSGVEYKWLVSPDECDPAELTDAFVALLHNCPDGKLPAERTAKPQEHWDRIAAGVGEGERNQSAAEYIGILLADLADPFNANAVQRLWENVQRWNLLNKPPMKESELAGTFKSILTRHQRRESGRGRQAQKLTEDRPFNPEEKVIPEWRLSIVESRPRIYRLYSPLWSFKARHGYIELDAAQMRNAESIAREALEQADVWVPATFDKTWRGDKDHESLAKQVIAAAEYLPAPLESKRDLVIAEMLHDAIGKARRLKEGERPDAGGGLCRDESGAVTFKFSRVWGPMAMSGDKIKRSELLDIMRRAGFQDIAIKINGKAVRLKQATGNSIATLAEMIETTEDGT